MRVFNHYFFLSYVAQIPFMGELDIVLGAGQLDILLALACIIK